MTQSHNWWTVEGHINNWKGDTAESFPDPRDKRIKELEERIEQLESLLEEFHEMRRREIWGDPS